MGRDLHATTAQPRSAPLQPNICLAARQHDGYNRGAACLAKSAPNFKFINEFRIRCKHQSIEAMRFETGVLEQQIHGCVNIERNVDFGRILIEPVSTTARSLSLNKNRPPMSLAVEYHPTPFLSEVSPYRTSAVHLPPPPGAASQNEKSLWLT